MLLIYNSLLTNSVEIFSCNLYFSFRDPHEIPHSIRNSASLWVIGMLQKECALKVFKGFMSSAEAWKDCVFLDRNPKLVLLRGKSGL